MLKLLNAELYRLSRKGTMYAYFAAMLLVYLAVTFIRSGGFREESVVFDCYDFFGAFPTLAGGFLFSAIYAEDLSSKNLISLVGFGINKAKIILVKFILAVVFAAVLLFGLAAVHVITYSVLGAQVTSEQVGVVFIIAVRFLLMTFAYTAVASLAVYGLQRVTFAVVTYFMFSLGMITGLILLVSSQLKVLEHVPEHIPSGLVTKIMNGLEKGGPLLRPFAEYLVFIAVIIALSVFAFHKKEMEF